jgi:hypothetical protein
MIRRLFCVGLVLAMAVLATGCGHRCCRPCCPPATVSAAPPCCPPAGPGIPVQSFGGAPCNGAVP